MVTFTLLGSIFSILLILSIFALTLSLSRDSSEKDRERISAAALSAQIALSVGSFCLSALSILMQNAIKFESILPVKDPHWWDMWGGLNIFVGIILILSGIAFGVLTLPLLLSKNKKAAFFLMFLTLVLDIFVFVFILHSFS